MTGPTVASAAVQIVASTDGFFDQLRAKLNPQADNLGDQLGDRIGLAMRQRLDAAFKDLPSARIDVVDTQARASVAQMRAQLDELAKNSPNIRIHVDGAVAAEAELAALQSQVDKLNGGRGPGGTGGDLGGIGSGAQGASHGIYAFLLPALGALATVVGPLVATGAAGFGTILLGAKGLEDQVKGGLTPAFQELQRTAQEALGPGVGAAVNQLEQALPKLEPLVAVFGNAIGAEADKFATYLNNGGFEKFTAYAERELPIVENAFNSALEAGVSFFNAITPLGNALLITFTDMATVIDKVSGFFAANGAGAGSGTKPQTSTTAINSFKVSGPGTSDLDKVGNNLYDFFVSGLLGGNEGSPQGAQNAADNARKLAAQGVAQDKFNAANLTRVNAVNLPDLSAQANLANQLDTQASALAKANVEATKLAAQLPLLANQEKYAGLNAQGLASQLNAFANSSDSIADKAQLLGAVLLASQGDALSYTGAISAGYSASQNLIDGFDAQQRSVINAKTGLIDYTKAGAAPLVSELQAMQTAAENAAEATYQHEVAQKGDSAALQDAQDIFEQLTGGTLVANAKQLGITTDQAQKLADQYFAFDGKTVTTDVQAIGLNNVNDTLNQLGEQLAHLTNVPWVIGISVSATANDIGKVVHDAVNNINAASNQSSAYQHAAGGWLQEGWSTAGEGAATEFLRKSGGNVQVYSHTQSLAMAGHLMQSSPAVGSGAGVLQNHITLELDGRVAAQTVNEVNLNDRRR